MGCYISDKDIIPRKDHRCHVCDQEIKKGEECHRGTYVDGGTIYSLYFHAPCWQFTEDWDQDDWDMNDPGEVTLEEVIVNIHKGKGAQ